RSGIASLMAAALFAVNPLHCESVCWISGRTDLISALFSLLALYFMCRSRTSHCLVNQFFAALLLSVGLLTKEMAAIMPLVAMAAYGLPMPDQPASDGRTDRRWDNWVRALRFSLPLWLVLLIYLWLRVQALGTLAGGYFSGFVRFMGGPSVLGIRGVETP